MVNIYVDGSYNIKTKESGWAFIILSSNKLPIKINGKVEDKYGFRNVTGELYAVIKAIQYLYTNNIITEINLYYDYLGIEKWPLYQWKANNKLTQLYRDIINDFIKKGFKINFIKVKSHSGNKYNDMVDLLAKEACGVNGS